MTTPVNRVGPLLAACTINWNIACPVTLPSSRNASARILTVPGCSPNCGRALTTPWRSAVTITNWGQVLY